MTAKMTDFGINPPSLMFVAVDDAFTFEVRLVAERVGDGAEPAE